LKAKTSLLLKVSKVLMTTKTTTLEDKLKLLELENGE
jgi:hypothetical protein